MASKTQHTQLKNKKFASVLFCILFGAVALPIQVYAKNVPDTIPSLASFIETVKDGNAGLLRGVYVSK
jgi:hypothetical protein